MGKSILLIDDDQQLSDLLRLHIENAGFELEARHSGSEGLTAAAQAEYAVVLLDWNLGDMEGIDVCREIRSNRPAQPIIMLTSRGDEIDKILALEMGADDYVTKPFSPRELVARMKALLRRIDRVPNSAEDSPDELLLGDVKILLAQRKIFRGELEIDLTAKEFDLVVFLALQHDKVFSRDQLLEEVWGYHSVGYENVVTSFISRVRKKLEVEPHNPRYIQTVHGVGYKFSTE